MDCEALQSAKLPSGLEVIPDFLFHFKNLQHIDIPSTVTSINNYALRHTGIKVLTIPEAVTYVGSWLLEYCADLEVINYNATRVAGGNNYVVTHAGYNTNGIRINVGKNVQIFPSAFCTPYITSYQQEAKIVSVVFEEGSVCESIGDSAFYKAYNLESIVLPASIKEIKANAFDYCTSLSTIYYMGTAEEFAALTLYKGNNAILNADVYYYSETEPAENGRYWHYDENGNPEFWLVGSEGLEIVTGIHRDTLEPYGMVVGIGTCDDEDIVIPSEYNGYPIREIAAEAFADQNKIFSVHIPDSVRIIGEKAFYKCVSLKRVTVSHGVTTIGSRAFSTCTALKSVKLPNTITEIPNACFEYCSSLTSFTIPESITAIVDSAFSYCTSLKSITIPDSVETVGSYAFYECGSALATVIIGSGVTTIGDYAFCRCTGLTSIYIGIGLRTVSSGAFHGCSALKVVYYSGTKEQWTANVYIGSSNTNLTNAMFAYK